MKRGREVQYDGAIQACLGEFEVSFVSAKLFFADRHHFVQFFTSELVEIFSTKERVCGCEVRESKHTLRGRVIRYV